MSKKMEENMKVVSVYLQDGLLTRIDKLASDSGMNRSRLVENMLEVTTIELERMNSLGILATARAFRDWKERAENWSVAGAENIEGGQHA